MFVADSKFLTKSQLQCLQYQCPVLQPEVNNADIHRKFPKEALDSLEVFTHYWTALSFPSSVHQAKKQPQRNALFFFDQEFVQ